MRLLLVPTIALSSLLAILNTALAQDCPPGSPGPPLVEWVTRVAPPPSTLKTLKKDHLPTNVTINVPVITLCGLWTFSKFSYDGKEPTENDCRNIPGASGNCCPLEAVGLTPPLCPNSESENPAGTRCCFGLDPVQLLMYGEPLGRTYKRMKNEHNAPDYRDHRDYDDFFACPDVLDEFASCAIPHFHLPEDVPNVPFAGCELLVSKGCKALDKIHPQWVLMRTEGSANPKWKWRKHVEGLQKDEDACTLEHRDHLRMYGPVPTHPQFGPWFVGTPHHDVPANDGCRLNHDVDNWISSRNLFAGSWIESGELNDKPGQDLSVQWWTLTSFGLPNSWRGAEKLLDGRGFVIGVDFDVPVPPCGTFLTKWGSSGSGDGQFDHPYGVAVDGSGNVYVTDYTNRVQKFDSNGTLLTKWGSGGSGDGQFNLPVGLAIDGSGNVYISDLYNNRVQKFDSNGTFLTKWGNQGIGDGQFDGLEGVAVDGSGNVYVTDYNNRVQKFDSNGTFLTKWGSQGVGDGQFAGPDGIAVDGSGNVYVTDNVNRVQKFDGSGTFLTKWGSYGSGDGQFEGPHGGAVDRSGNVYVLDVMNNRVQKFDSNGTFLTKWGSYGDAKGQFEGPVGMAVDGSGNVYVSDFGNDRIQKFACP